jgi:SAM-dependent methyltransferase
MPVVADDRDAYGAELTAYLRDGSKTETIERDDGYIETHEGVGDYFAEYKDWKPLEQEAIALASGRVLDVGCGAGRVALYLQGQGLQVVAIDNSPGAIQMCTSRNVVDARLMAFTSINSSLGHLNCLVLFGNNFGLFGSLSTARWLLGKIYTLSSPDATIVATAVDPYGTDNPDHLRYHERNRKRGRMPGQLRIRVRHRLFIGPWFDYLFASQSELEKILDGTSWKLRDVLRHGGPSYVAVMEKKPNNHSGIGRRGSTEGG